MEVEGIRLVRDWLAGAIDPAKGVNALIPGVPRYAGDPQPPLVQAFYHALSLEEVALQLAPEDTAKSSPCIVVWEYPAAGSVIDSEGHVATGEQDATMHLAVELNDVRQDPVAVGRDGRYATRAIRRSLNAMNLNAASGVPTISANGVDLISVDRIQRIPSTQQHHEGRLVFITVASITFRDNSPFS